MHARRDEIDATHQRAPAVHVHRATMDSNGNAADADRET